MNIMDYDNYISTDKNIRFERPCITGTRIAVEDLIQWLSAGMSVEDIISDFPQLNEEQINACIAYNRSANNQLTASTNKHEKNSSISRFF
jgi:uncharacterized protein (DUF433 family)